MKISLACILNLILFIITNGQPAGWYPQNSGTTQGLHSVYFINDSSGWIVGNGGTILHTNNKGSSWIHQNSPTFKNLYGTDFIDNTTGCAVGEDGIIIKTTNGGYTWVIQPIDTLINLTAVDFITDSTGWISGTGGTVLSTNDGGSNWNLSGLGTTFAMNDVFFINNHTGFIVGGNQFYRTTNGGNTWQYVGGIIAEDVYHSSVYFPTADSGWVVGSYGDIFSGYTGIIAMTRDGGDNFYYVGDTPDPLFSIYFVDAYKGWSAGQNGTIIHTSNGGISWNSQNSGTLEWLSSIFFTNDTTGWAVGGNGVILSTSSGGIVAINETSYTTNLKTFKLNQNYPNPFNPTTSIRYFIGGRQHVLLKIYDILGKEIKTLANEEKPAGAHSVEFDANNLSSGIYFYQLQAGDFTQTKKMILMR